MAEQDYLEIVDRNGAVWRLNVKDMTPANTVGGSPPKTIVHEFQPVFGPNTAFTEVDDASGKRLPVKEENSAAALTALNTLAGAVASARVNSNVQQMPATGYDTDSLVQYEDPDYVVVGGVRYAINRTPVNINTTGDHLIVAAQGAGVRIHVLGFKIIANAAVVAGWYSGTGTTTLIDGPWNLAAAGYGQKDFDRYGVGITAANQALNLNTGGAVQIGGRVSWIARP